MGNVKEVIKLHLVLLQLSRLTRDLLTSRQIEAARIAVTRYMKREGKVWIRIFLTNLLLINQLR